MDIRYYHTYFGYFAKLSLEVSTTGSRQHVFTACVPKYVLLSQPPTHVVAQRGGRGKVLDLAVESKRSMKSFQVPPPARGPPVVRTERRLPLLKDRSIIDFMSAYTEQHWPKVRCVHAVYS
jgi:hypothetical protein